MFFHTDTNWDISDLSLENPQSPTVDASQKEDTQEHKQPLTASGNVQ